MKLIEFKNFKKSELSKTNLNSFRGGEEGYESTNCEATTVKLLGFPIGSDVEESGDWYPYC